MTVLLKKCAAFACDRTVSELRWALGHRTCLRHEVRQESVTEMDHCWGRPRRAKRAREEESWPIPSDHVRLADVIGAAERACGNA